MVVSTGPLCTLSRSLMYLIQDPLCTLSKIPYVPYPRKAEAVASFPPKTLVIVLGHDGEWYYIKAPPHKGTHKKERNKKASLS